MVIIIIMKTNQEFSWKVFARNYILIDAFLSLLPEIKRTQQTGHFKIAKHSFQH